MLVFEKAPTCFYGRFLSLHIRRKLADNATEVVADMRASSFVTWAMPELVALVQVPEPEVSMLLTVDRANGPFIFGPASVLQDLGEHVGLPAPPVDLSIDSRHQPLLDALLASVGYVQAR